MFELRGGCLYWSRNSSSTQKSCMDFSKTRCELTILDNQICLRPLPGRRWHPKDSHSRAGSIDPLLLQEAGDTDRWTEHIRQHIAYAHALREQKIAALKRKRIQRLNLDIVDVGGLPRDCDEVCPVCLEPIDEPHAESTADGPQGGGSPGIAKTPCKHLFHAECIQEWGVRCRDCPVCRGPLCAEMGRRRKSRQPRRRAPSEGPTR